MRRWSFFLLAILVGAALGIWYGRFIQPVEYTDTTLGTLRGDYKADYVLMVAETFASQRDGGLALNQLGQLTSADPAELILQAIVFAERTGYADQDLSRLRALLEAVQTIVTPTMPAAP